MYNSEKFFRPDPRDCCCWYCCKIVKTQPQSTLGRCSYAVTNTNNAGLVQAQTALNVLGVADCIGEVTTYDVLYQLRCEGGRRKQRDHRADKPALKAFNGSKGMLLMKDVAVACIVREFHAVVISDTFLEHISDGECPKERLLTQAIAELRNNSFVRVFYDPAGWIHKDRNRSVIN